MKVADFYLGFRLIICVYGKLKLTRIIFTGTTDGVFFFGELY